MGLSLNCKRSMDTAEGINDYFSFFLEFSLIIMFLIKHSRRIPTTPSQSNAQNYEDELARRERLERSRQMSASEMELDRADRVSNCSFSCDI